MSARLSASYEHCRRLARRAGSHFYFSFFLLPRQKRRSMYALYAFFRQTDDLADAAHQSTDRRGDLCAWREALTAGLEGQSQAGIWPALADTVMRYGIPPRYLHAAVDGAMRDLDHTRYATFAELERYCYEAASVVGLACIHVWGFQGPAALESAVQCGIALQLTNILRDLKEDADRGRIYLPLDELALYRYAPDELLRGVRDERLDALLRFQVERAETYYQRAAPLADQLTPDGRRAFLAMVATYHGLLDKIRRLQGEVLARRVQIGRWRQMRIAISWFLHGSAPTGSARHLLGAGRLSGGHAP